jgi:ABC-type uncharacterized transport system involved in gliding motility auxiliary subunit
MKKYLPRIAFIAGVVLIVTGLIIYSIYPMMPGGPVASILGLIILAINLYFNWNEIKDSISVRSAKYGTNTFIFILVIFFIVILINVFGQKYRLKIDATQTKAFTLSEQSIQIIKNLDEPLTIYGFIPSNDSTTRSVFKDMCDRYVYYSGGRVICKVLDPDKNPGLAKKFHVTSAKSRAYGFQKGKDYTRADVIEEEEFTSAIIRLKSDIKKAIYFTTGHGEGDITSDGEFQFNKLNEKLKNLGYQTEMLSPNFSEIPKRCATLVLLSPETGMMPGEIKAINDYFEDGGNILILLDPFAESNLVSYLKTVGLIVHNDLVVDYVHNIGQNPLIPVITRYMSHPVIMNDKKSTIPLTFFDRARSMRHIGKKMDNLQITPIFTTSMKTSYGETDLKTYLEENKYEYDKEKDMLGPLALGFAITRLIEEETETGTEKIESKMIVIGDSDFASNRWIDYYGNSFLILNAINWLSGDYELISIDRPSSKPNIISMTQQQKQLMHYILIYLLPGIMIFTGLLIWWKKRKA